MSFLYKKADSVDVEFIEGKIKNTIINYIDYNIDKLCKANQHKFIYNTRNDIFIWRTWDHIIAPLIEKYWKNNLPKLRICLKSIMNPKSARNDELIIRAVHKLLGKLTHAYEHILIKYRPASLKDILPISLELFQKGFIVDLKTYILANQNEIFGAIDWAVPNYFTTINGKTNYAIELLIKYLSNNTALMNSILKKYHIDMAIMKKNADIITIEELCKPLYNDNAIQQAIQLYLGWTRDIAMEADMKQEHIRTIAELENINDDNLIDQPGPVITFDPWRPNLRDAPLILARKFNKDKTAYEDVVLIGRTGEHHMPLLDRHPDVRDNLSDTMNRPIFTCAYLHGLICFLSNNEYNGYTDIKQVARLIKQIEPNILKVYLSPDTLPGQIIRKAQRLNKRIK